IDTLAMREAKTNEPKGGKFNQAVGKFLRRYGLDRIHKSDRSRMRKYAGKLEEIDAWRAKQPAEQQLELNHPRVVYARWSRPPRPAGSKRDKNPAPERPNLWLALNHATDEEVTAAFRSKTLAWFFDLIPPEWFPQIGDRLRGQILRQERARHPNTRL